MGTTTAKPPARSHATSLVSPNEPPRATPLGSSPGTSPATTKPVDWKLIWAQRGFRYFFFAMLISLFGSGMNFAGARKIIPADGSLVLVESDQAVPLLYVTRAGGRTAVVVNMNPVDAEFFYSAWFPVLVYGAATHLAGREESLASTYTPGATIPLPGAGDTETTSIVGPDGALMSATGRKFGPLEQPGFYQLRNGSSEWLA